MNHKEYKEETRQRYGEPIEYVLSRLKQGQEVELFDIINAQDQLDTLRKDTDAQKLLYKRYDTTS